MKKLLALMALVASSSFADTTANLITSGTTHTWTGVSTGAIPTGCGSNGSGGCAGGPGALYDPATNTIHFSYGQATVAQTFAINQALANAGAGIQVNGYSYSWDINNLNGDNRQGSTDTLTATVNTMNYNNTTVRRTDTWTYNTKFDWTTFSGDVAYVNPGPVSDFGNMSVSFSGRDTGYWGGYFGPQVRNVSLRMNYGVDLCASNPLSSTSCAGYQQAYTDQQCVSNPLYSTQCSGYAAAYQTQQCSTNPLFSPACVGYDTAYFNQQCSISPLYSQSCSGYSVAYHDQQCSVNPLFASDCVGYEQAYLNAQCIRNSLYSTQCEGYATAYAIKNLVPLQNSSAVNQVLSNTAAAAATVPTPVESATTTPSTTSTTSVTSVTSVVAPQPTVASPTSATSQSTTPPPPASAKEEPKPSGPPNTRQALAERRQEAAKQEAVAKGKDLAKNMGTAKSMADQVAAQGLVAAAMGYNPAFAAYQGGYVPDSNNFYRPYTVYGNQKNVENRSTSRMFGGSEVKHQDMVNSQYNLGN